MPIVVERVKLIRLVGHDPDDRRQALPWSNDTILVNVIAVMEYEIEAFGGHLPIGCEIPVFITLAPSDAEAQLAHRRSQRWERPRTARTAAFATNGELVEVLVPCLKSADLDMHGVAEFGIGRRRTLLRDLAHALVGGHRPVDLYRLPRHTTAPIEWAR